jgi:carbon monoxide dehydrogenase subunit G
MELKSETLLPADVAVGPVKAKFKARLTIKDIVAPLHYTIAFEGQGGAAGHAKGEARVALEPIDTNQTMLKYEANATIGGRVAQVGSRLVDIAAKKLAGEFFDRFNALMTPAEETLTEVDSSGAPEISALKRSWWDRVRKRRAH